MYSPARKVRASIRRTILLLLIGFVSTLLLVETVIQIGENPYSPTQSVGLMLNRSQMLLAKDILLEPTIFTCQSKPTTPNYPMYIVVKTRAEASGSFFQRRMFTRTSWAKEAHARGIPVIYAVGRASDPHVQRKLELEHKTYGDLLQFNYIDAYYNITIKTTGILNWFVKRGCQHVTPYLFISDDDILLNLPRFTRMFSGHTLQSNTIYGLYLTNIEPHPSGRWAVSLRDYPNQTYPDFITGASTLYPTNVIYNIVERIFDLVERNQSMIFLDDVLITGIIAEQLGIRRASMSGIEDCSYTDLYSRLIINECNNVRRTYVWARYILKRIRQNTREIDRLINTTVYLKWRGDFRHMRNGTAIAQLNPIDRSILIILSTSYSKIFFILVFLLIFLFVSIYLPKLLSTNQSTSTMKLPMIPSTSPKMTSTRLLAPVKA